MAKRSTGDENEPVQGQIPTAIIDQLKSVLQKVSPGGIVLDDEVSDFSFGDRTMTVRDHNTFPNGSMKEMSRPVMGPSIDGYVLTLRWFPCDWEGYMSGIYTHGTYFSREYWMEYLAHYTLPHDKGYIEVRWNYGAATDQNILTQVQSIIALVGYLEKGSSIADRWSEKVAKPQERLTKVTSKYRPDVNWKVVDQTLSSEFKTINFDIHTIDDKGHVAPEAHVETGPQHEGFIIRLSPIAPQPRRQPRPAYGRSYGPYWNHYYAIYDEQNDPFRLDILYGVRTDKKLIEDVIDALDEMFQEPSRF